MSKKESLIFVESCIRNIQQEKEISKNIKLIQNAIKREFDIPLEISIVDNKSMFLVFSFLYSVIISLITHTPLL